MLWFGVWQSAASQTPAPRPQRKSHPLVRGASARVKPLSANVQAFVTGAIPPDSQHGALCSGGVECAVHLVLAAPGISTTTVPAMRQLSLFPVAGTGGHRPGGPKQSCRTTTSASGGPPLTSWRPTRGPAADRRKHPMVCERHGRSTHGNEALCRREMRPSRAIGGKQPTKVRTSGDGRFRYVPIKARDTALLGRLYARGNRQRR